MAHDNRRRRWGVIEVALVSRGSPRRRALTVELHCWLVIALQGGMSDVLQYETFSRNGVSIWR